MANKQSDSTTRTTIVKHPTKFSPINKRLFSVVQKESVQITGDRATLVGDDCLARPYDPDALKDTLTANVWHNRAIQFKAIVTMGLGYQVFSKGQKPGHDEPWDDDAILVKYPWLLQANEDESFLEVCTEMGMDSEAIGDGWWEVETDGRGFPLRLYHIPGETMWIEKAKGTTKIPGFKQRANGSIRSFHRYGDQANKEGRPGMIVRFKNPMIGNAWYGTPDYIPALRAIMLSVASHDYNYAFFQNGGIPAWLMLVAGGKLSKKSNQDAIDFFRGNFSFPENAHKMLLLETESKDVEFTMERISAEIEEMSFSKLGEANKDEILAADGVSARLLGIAVPGKLGGGSDILADLQVLKETVIRPKQKLREFVINTRLMRDGDFIKFNEIDIAPPEAAPVDDTEQAMEGDESVTEGPIEKAKSIITGLNYLTSLVAEAGKLDELEEILKNV